MTKDLTVGSPLKIFIWFTIPILIGNLFQQLYNVVDTVIVGRYLGEEALAAVGTTGCLMFLVIGFANGVALKTLCCLNYHSYNYCFSCIINTDNNIFQEFSNYAKYT